MAEPVDGTAVRSLLATPPAEFVAARNALAKSLRADGDRDSAQAVAALRKPSWVDWALNTIAGDHGELVDGYAGAAAASRQAQDDAVARREGVDLRTALRELREAVAALAPAVNGALRNAGRIDETAEIVARLGEIAGDETMAAALRSGTLGAENIADVAPPAKAAGKKAGAKRAATTERPADRSKKADDAASLDAARRKKELQRRHDKAQEALETATTSLRSAQEAETAAGDELERAEKAVLQAKQSVNEAKRKRIAAGKSLTKAQRTAEAAARALGTD